MSFTVMLHFLVWIRCDGCWIRRCLDKLWLYDPRFKPIFYQCTIFYSVAGSQKILTLTLTLTLTLSLSMYRKLWWQISAMCFSGRVESQRLICLEASFAEVLQPAFRGAAHRPSPSCSLTCEKSVLHSIGKQLRCLSSRSVLTGLPWFSTRSKRERGLGKITVSHSEANRLKIWLSPGIALPISQHPVWATTGISSLHAWNEMHAVSRALWTERSKKC